MDGHERTVQHGLSPENRVTLQENDAYSSPYDAASDAMRTHQRRSRIVSMLEIIADDPLPTRKLARKRVAERNPRGVEEGFVSDELWDMRRDFVRALGRGCVELAKEAYDRFTDVPLPTDIPQYDPYGMDYHVDGQRIEKSMQEQQA